MGNASTGLRGAPGARGGTGKGEEAELPVGRELCRSDSIAVFCERHAPNRLPEQMHRQARLLLTGDSEGQITWRRKSGSSVAEKLAADQFCLITAACRYSIRWAKAQEILRLDLGERLVEEHLAFPLHGVIVEDLRPLARLGSFLSSLAEELWEASRRAAAPSRTLIEGLGTALAALVLEKQFQAVVDPAQTPKLPETLLERLTTYVEANVENEVSVEEMARIAGLCLDHFGRRFKNSTGYAPSQYILRARVAAADRLLRTGEFRVAEVALRLGFCDQSHFHRQFVKFLGKTPKTVLREALAPKAYQQKSDSSKIAAPDCGTVTAFPAAVRLGG